MGGKDNMVRSFFDLTVYQNLYKAMIVILTEVVTKMPNEEKFDLTSQIRRACKAPPALIAEGYAQKHHRKEWKKYLFDAIGECNEMIVHLSCIKDVYSSYVNSQKCEKLIETYNISGKQLYRLAESWGLSQPSSPQPNSQPSAHPHNQ